MEKTGRPVHAYCLMGNHFHLVVETPRPQPGEDDLRGWEWPRPTGGILAPDIYRALWSYPLWTVAKWQHFCKLPATGLGRASPATCVRGGWTIPVTQVTSPRPVRKRKKETRFRQLKNVKNLETARAGCVRQAVIDVGTNSVKLLVADVEGSGVSPVWEGSEQTRLGKGFYPEHRLRSAAMEHTAEAVARYAAKARELHTSRVRVIATSAVRDAVNQSEMMERVRKLCGLEMEVITGEQEADWAFVGVRSDPALAHGALLILDVGGGSTEFILGQGAHPSLRHSFQVGTVRLHEQLLVSDPPSPAEWQACWSHLQTLFTREVKPLFQPHLDKLGSEPVQLVGTGGTTAILAAMELRLSAFDRKRIEETRLTRAKVGRFQEQLWSMSLEDRQKLPGLPPNRADVILFGVAVFASVMEVFGFDAVRVSTRGIRYGALASWK